MNVAFVNENTLGHTSYLPRFVDSLNSHPEWGCRAIRLDATPLPPELRGAERGIRGLSRFGLDWQIARWRKAASIHAALLLQRAQMQGRIDAIIVNTQSVGLEIPRRFPEIPCWVALDATFEQLARSPWFTSTDLARWFHPFTLGWLRNRERELYAHAKGFLPWSDVAAQSLRKEYKIADQRIMIFPPSLEDPLPVPYPERSNTKHKILFIGGDFRRKGGQMLVDIWRECFQSQAELHVVTRTQLPQEPGLHVHVGVEAGSMKWRSLWNSADLFVFPSRLETFGIVLVEAMAFGVPIISTNTGAAADFLADGGAGILLSSLTPNLLRDAIHKLISSPETRARFSSNGRARYMQDFELTANTRRLAHLIQAR